MNSGNLRLLQDVENINPVPLLRDKNITIGKISILRSGTIIYPNVIIGDNFKTGHNVVIRLETIIGDNVLVGTNSVIEGYCIIGNDVIMQTNVYLSTHITIGDKVFLGPNVVFTNSKYMDYKNEELRNTIVGKGAKIGANATILPGLVIGEGSIVGAGSVVTKDIKDGITVAGNPAKIIFKVVKNSWEKSYSFPHPGIKTYN